MNNKAILQILAILLPALFLLSASCTQKSEPEYAGVLEDLKEKLSELRTRYGDSEELDQKYIQTYLDQ